MASSELRQLTKFLRLKGQDVYTCNEEGGAVTRFEALAELLWKMALGYTEERMDTDADGKRVMKEVTHKPASWAMQMVYERLEGKAPAALDESKDQLTAADKVSELARARLNSEADALIALSEHPRSVDGPRNGTTDTEKSGDESSVAGEDS